MAFFDPVESALASAEVPSPGSYKKKIKNSLITIIILVSRIIPLQWLVSETLL